jgi:hypothetical protein
VYSVTLGATLLSQTQLKARLSCRVGQYNCEAWIVGGAYPFALIGDGVLCLDAGLLQADEGALGLLLFAPVLCAMSVRSAAEEAMACD